jgi:hypothetical protein
MVDLGRCALLRTKYLGLKGFTVGSLWMIRDRVIEVMLTTRFEASNTATRYDAVSLLVSSRGIVGAIKLGRATLAKQ